jgi:hypothetical protein
MACASMLRDQHLTDGIGARTARSIHFTSSRDFRAYRVLTFVTSARQKKTETSARFKGAVVKLAI